MGTHSLTHSLTHSRSLARSFTHSLIHSFTHSLIHSFTHSFTHSLIHSLIHSFTHSLIHSLTHVYSMRNIILINISKIYYMYYIITFANLAPLQLGQVCQLANAAMHNDMHKIFQEQEFSLVFSFFPVYSTSSGPPCPYVYPCVSLSATVIQTVISSSMAVVSNHPVLSPLPGNPVGSFGDLGIER